MVYKIDKSCIVMLLLFYSGKAMVVLDYSNKSKIRQYFRHVQAEPYTSAASSLHKITVPKRFRFSLKINPLLLKLILNIQLQQYQCQYQYIYIAISMFLILVIESINQDFHSKRDAKFRHVNHLNWFLFVMRRTARFS